MVAIIGVLGAAASVFGTATFYFFIHEEAMQTRQMGIYLLIKNEMWAEALIQLNSLQEHLNEAMRIYNKIGIKEPSILGVFGAYFRAVQDQIDTYRTIVSKKLEGLPAITTGTLRVLSSPSEGKIFLDGVDTGLMTPETFKDVKAGTHRVRVTRWMPRIKQFISKEETVTVEVGKRTEILVILGEA